MPTAAAAAEANPSAPRDERERAAGGEEGNEKKTLDDEGQKAAGRTPPRQRAKNRRPEPRLPTSA
jgi:hypothetical protein